MKELIRRLILPSPVFFNKVKYVGGILAGSGAFIMSMSYEGSKLLNLIKPYAIEMVVAGAVMVAVAQLTVKPEMPNKEL
jgi:hypothetical protein